MTQIRTYSWNDWISVPTNREIYKESMKKGIKLYHIEKARREQHLRNSVHILKGRPNVD